ncbi:MAG: NAD-dependent epimerase/dehydratase family protein [Sphingobacteriales bacterium]|nr:MAG: NAD-dependent epimerase/dehydratase family protein [Sphingobacteriales bacterium]
MNSILLTGASGFLGGYLVQALSGRGYSVRALYRNTLPTPALQHLPGVEWVQADLLDVYDVEAVLEGIEGVIHSAATVSFAAGDADALLHNNRETTANLVDGMIDAQISRLVHVSSVAAIGRSKEGAVLTEEVLWEESKSNSVYARSKWAAEAEAWRGAGEGLSVAIVNPGIILGAPLQPSGWHSGSAALMGVVNREFPFYTDGINGWVDVADVVKAILLLLESPIAEERFILAQNASYKEVFTLMAQALGKKPPHIRATPWLSGLVWRWNAIRSAFGKPVTVTKETARTAQQQVRYSSDKFRNAFPQYVFTPLEETVEWMAKAFRTESGTE